MKFFLAFAAVVAVAVASPVQRALVVPGPIGPTPIIEEEGTPIAIGPAILEPTPITIGPAIVHPEVVVEPAAGSPPVVQIIINVQAPTFEPEPIAVGPAIVEEIDEPEPIIVINPIVVHPIVEEPTLPGPVNVVDQVVEPVQVVEPIIPGPVIVPVVPAVVIPQELN